MDNHSQKPDLRLPLVLVLTTLVVLDLSIIAGIFIHGKANFPELIKHLKS